MNPLEEGSERALGEFDGSWEALDWSADDRELLAVEFDRRILGDTPLGDRRRLRAATARHAENWRTRPLDSGAVQR